MIQLEPALSRELQTTVDRKFPVLFFFNWETPTLEIKTSDRNIPLVI